MDIYIVSPLLALTASLILTSCSISPEGAPPDWAYLNDVNHKWNQSIEYVSDKEQYGKNVDAYSYARPTSGKGDCEDYALSKFVDLQERGFPKERMTVAVCKLTPDTHTTGGSTTVIRRGLHAFLVIDGKWVMDSYKTFGSADFVYNVSELPCIHDQQGNPSWEPWHPATGFIDQKTGKHYQL